MEAPKTLKTIGKIVVEPDFSYFVLKVLTSSYYNLVQLSWKT